MSETTSQHRAAAGKPSGLDLARVALHQAREAAKVRGEGGTRKVKRHARTAAARRDGREPAEFAAVIQGLMAARAWTPLAAGGSVLDQWPAIAATVSPQLPEHVTAVAFHAESGRLDLRPDSPAYATQIRLLHARIVTAANRIVSTDVVRAVRVLPAGTVPAPRPAQPAPDMAVRPEAPVKTRETASAGYRRTLAVYHAAVQRVERT